MKYKIEVRRNGLGKEFFYCMRKASNNWEVLKIDIKTYMLEPPNLQPARFDNEKRARDFILDVIKEDKEKEEALIRTIEIL